MKLLVTTLFLTLTILALPAAAGTLSIDVNGVLGPLLDGADPIHLDGAIFTATGTIDQNAAPISVSGDSATYYLPGNLQIMLGNTTLTGYDAMLTMTAPSAGPDTMVLDFSIFQNAAPDVTASLTLPSGTLDGIEVQSFWASVTESDSSLSYSVAGTTDNLTGTLGITGTASIGDAPPSSVPEPGTIGLLAGGLALGIVIRNVAHASACRCRLQPTVPRQARS
jgi:hypothetical protein